jgi:hypothetical protein
MWKCVSHLSEQVMHGKVKPCFTFICMFIKWHWHTLRDSLSDLSLTPFQNIMTLGSETGPRGGDARDAVKYMYWIKWVVLLNMSLLSSVSYIDLERVLYHLDWRVFWMLCHPYFYILSTIRFIQLGCTFMELAVFRFGSYCDVHLPHSHWFMWIIAGWHASSFKRKNL